MVLIDDFYLKGLFGAFIIELVGAVIGIYRKVDFFTESTDNKSVISENIETESKTTLSSQKLAENQNSTTKNDPKVVQKQLNIT